MYASIETGRIRSQPKGELWFRVKDIKCQHSSPCRGYFDPPWGEPTVSWKSFLFACTMQASPVLISPAFQQHCGKVGIRVADDLALLKVREDITPPGSVVFL